MLLTIDPMLCSCPKEASYSKLNVQASPTTIGIDETSSTARRDLFCYPLSRIAALSNHHRNILVCHVKKTVNCN